MVTTVPCCLQMVYIFGSDCTTSGKHLRTKVTPSVHLTYNKNGGNQVWVLNDKKWKFLHKIMLWQSIGIAEAILIDSPTTIYDFKEK